MALAAGIKRLTAAGVPSPAVDARGLAAYVLGVEMSQLVLLEDLTGSDLTSFVEAFSEVIQRREAREPLQWITGVAPFGPLDLAVGPGVFIPRPETELLADWAVRQQQNTYLDLCTGSGALSAYISHYVPQATVIGVDISRSALGYARRNATSVQFVQADLAQLPFPESHFDCVVANPPYVPEVDPVSGVPTAVEPEVARDPHSAVFAGTDGLAVMADLARSCYRLLSPGGVVGVEHDESHQRQVADIFAAAGFTRIEPRRDLAGRPRHITAVKPR